MTFMRTFWSIIWPSAFALCCGSTLEAQATRPLAVDATIGTSYGWGGSYTGRDGVAGAITLVPWHATARIAALTLGGRGSLPHGDTCIIAAGSSSGCLPRFPSMTHLGLLGGFERTRSGRSIRALMGPALFKSGSTSTLGGLGQLDASAGSAHLSVVATVRGELVRHAGETLRLGSLSLGIRVQ